MTTPTLKALHRAADLELADEGGIADDDRNLSLRHRHGASWAHSEPEVPASERNPVALRWVVASLVVLWVGVILLVRGCA